MQQKIPCVYILTNRKNGALYVGVTTNLEQRIYHHKKCLVQGFTSKYKINRLVYYEAHESIISAIEREKQLKKWRRQWKINLIEKENPQWSEITVL